jgi:hypothetical protein
MPARSAGEVALPHFLVILLFCELASARPEPRRPGIPEAGPGCPLLNPRRFSVHWDTPPRFGLYPAIGASKRRERRKILNVRIGSSDECIMLANLGRMDQVVATQLS